MTKLGQTEAPPLLWALLGASLLWCSLPCPAQAQESQAPTFAEESAESLLERGYAILRTEGGAEPAYNVLRGALDGVRISARRRRFTPLTR